MILRIKKFENHWIQYITVIDITMDMETGMLTDQVIFG